MAQDTLATCVESNCGQVFTIEGGEKEFYEKRGYKLPKRCPSCRAKRKAIKEAAAQGTGENVRGTI